ncbi:hypothetical protein CS0771_32900 [Catellatospora sp. IY07-71]|nr:hypothetical protein CS0771_32900 [Catellatospora sp. IY07-71]
MTVIAMWAHPRAVSTAFLRMMLERGDVTVVHEPLVTLADWHELTMPALDGAGTVTLHDAGAVLAHLAALGRDRTVFFKDTLEYRHQHLFDHPEQVADMVHTFIVRDPAKAIASHYAMKPTVTCPEIGFEHQWDLFELARRVTGRTPLVIRSEELTSDPAGAVGRYCARVGLPFLPHALRWRPEDRPEWHRTRQWHVDASASSGFAPIARSYDATVDNDPRLRAFHDHHLPFYQRLIAHAS